jgi:hypothetical protein
MTQAHPRLPSAEYVEVKLLMALPAHQVKTQPHQLSITAPHRMQRIHPHAALTYVRMIHRQHATLEFKQPLKHRNRIRVS